MIPVPTESSLLAIPLASASEGRPISGGIALDTRYNRHNRPLAQIENNLISLTGQLADSSDFAACNNLGVSG
jgi:hypothetical protein